MVRAEVEHEHVVRELRRDLARGTVRQREDDDVVPHEVLDRRRQEDAVGQGSQVRLVLAEERARVAVRRHGADLHLGVPGEQAERLPARVPGRTRDRDSDRHMHHYT